MRDAFAENFAVRGELGAAVAVTLEGSTVVDLWSGWADSARTRAWRRDTLVNVFSVGKALAALCVLRLASRSQVELDEPVSRRWPQFADGGKAAITVRELLSHRAGLAAIRGELPEDALYDWETVTGALARQEPWWTPGSAHGYHVHTFGFLVGELVRRVAGESIGSFLERELAAPLHAELSFGLARERRERCAEYVFDSHSSIGDRGGERPIDSELRRLAYLNPPGATGIGTVNTDAWRDAELPSANLHADARSVARLYGSLASERSSPLERDVLAQATREASAGEDLVLGRPSRFGLGFQLTHPERPFGPGPNGFGHFGAGGSVGFADPDAAIGFAYVMNRGGPQWRDPRNRALIDALYDALGTPGTGAIEASQQPPAPAR